MRRLPVFISIVAFLYVAIRVFTVALTHDEGWTYFEYVQYSVYKIVSGFSPRANNHILNTLLTKFCCLFSEHQFALRLPNLLAFALYLYAANKIAGILFKKPLLRTALVVCLITNYILLEFFGLCRGYGLGIGCMLYAIYQLLQYSYQPGNKKHLHYTLLFAIAATYANFAILNATVGIFLCAAWIHYRHEQKFIHAIKLPVLYGLVLLSLCAYPIWHLMQAHELYYGGNNFIDDTLSSMLIEYIGHGPFTTNKDISIILLIASLSIAALYTTIRTIKTKNITYALPVTILLIAIILAHVQFYLLHSLLPVSRTALYLYPLMMLTLFCAIALLYEHYRGVSMSLGCLLAAFNICICAPNLNFNHTREWWTDTYNREVLQYIDRDKAIHLVKLWGFFPTSNSLNYYIGREYNDKIDKMPCCITDYKEALQGDYDYLYLRDVDDMSTHPEYKRIQGYHDGAFVLYKKER
jgi:hypothetical protein